MDKAWEKAAEHEHEREREFKSMQSIVERYVDTIRQRLKGIDLSELEEKNYDKEMINDAIDERFEEAKLYKKRRFLPLMLSEKDRSEFLDPDWDRRDDPVPVWITLIHILFMAWTIINAHHPKLFILGFLFFLGFAQVSSQFQNKVYLKPAMLVGFFLAGLVIHGGLQAWWIEPVLGNLSEAMLMISATMLTAFNDNAAITYLSTLVPNFSESLKYAVLAGAIAGGGLTIIANAPNPAGQALLKEHFGGAVSPLGLVKAAIVPTIIVWLCLALF